MENRKSILVKVAVAVALIAVVIFGAIIINNKEAQIKDLNSETTALNSEVAQRDSILNDVFQSFNEIENSLEYVKQRRDQIELPSDEDGTISQHESIVNDIRLLDSLLEQNSEKVKTLEAKLKKSGIEMASLNKMILKLNNDIKARNTEVASLKQEIQEREEQIAELNSRVDGLQTEIEFKDKNLTAQSNLIRKQDSALNKGYLVYGTFKELKDNGLVERDGILGIGGKKTTPGNFDDEDFMKIDIREAREIPLFSKRVNFITEHPDSSYRFLTDDEHGLITYLEIDNPDEFWKLSKYAVIETK